VLVVPDARAPSPHCITRNPLVIGRTFRTGLTLVTGWWSVIAFILNIVVIIQNIAHYCSTLGLADVPEGGFPVAPQQPDVRTPPVQRPSAIEPSNPYRQL